VRQKPRELLVVPIGQRVRDVIDLERPQKETVRVEFRSRDHTTP
jgi:hypothetical protein